MKLGKMYLIFGLIGILISAFQVNAEDHCVMRGLCEQDPVTLIDKPCAYNGPPLPLTDESSIKFLTEVCPTLNAGSDFAVCCDEAQVEAFQSSLDILATFFQRCPSCYHNLAIVFCHLTCSPKQSSFLEVLCYSYIQDGKRTVNEMNYYITEEFAQGLFDSCKDVQLPFSTIKAVDITCGSHMFHCSPHLWLGYMGSHDPSPYQINFNFVNTPKIVMGNNTFYPMNETVVPCSQAVSEDGVACSCVDCPYNPIL